MADRLFEQGADVDPILTHRVAQGLASNTTKNSTWQKIVTWLEGVLTLAATSITEDSTHRFVTDAQITSFGTVQQIKTFRSPSTSDITNSSSTVYVDTDLLVALTPKSATSKLIVSFTAPFDTAASQTGTKIKIQYKVGAGAWTDLLVGSQTHAAQERIAGETVNSKMQANAMDQLDSPGISDIVQFKIVFAAFVNTFNTTYSSLNGARFIKVEEVLL